MYKNVFIGKNAQNQPKRILILGESHYEESGRIDGGTASVVKYLAINGNDNKTQFYKNIMRTFGYEISKESRNEFWNKVYCGNYVNDPCGKGKNNPAKSEISKNRTKYNDDLFNFINENGIDIILCFSRLVYNSLPSFSKSENQKQLTDKTELLKHRYHELYKFEYLPDFGHKHSTVKLKKPLIVYGFKHPSACYSYSTYYKSLEKEINEIGL